MTLVLISLVGGFGALMRFILDGVIRSGLGRNFPWGTLIINVSGSILLGIVTGLALQNSITADKKLIIGTGFCGGYTTFSTASFESVRLLEERRFVAAFMNTAGTLVAAFIGVALGLTIGQL